MFKTLLLLTRGVGVDMAQHQRKCMARMLSATIALLLHSVLFFPLAFAADSTISTNTTWSGTLTLDGNVTIATGTTLTISPGTTVDAGTYGIIVEGVLEASEAHFFSSTPPISQGSHGQGMWPGIVIEVGGEADFSDVTVANASAGVVVKGDFIGQQIVFNDAYRGIAVMGGSATVNDFEANRIDYEALYVESGSLNLDNGIASEVAVGIANQGTTTITDFTVEEAGVGIQSFAGTLDVDGFAVLNTSVGIATVSGASTMVQSVYGTNVALVADAGDTNDFTLKNAIFSGERLVVGQGVTSLLLDDIDFTSLSSSELRPVVDIKCEGMCTLKSSRVDLAPIAIAVSGSGTTTLELVEINGSLNAVQASGSGHLIAKNLTAAASQTGISVQTPTSSLHDIHVMLTANDALGVDVLGGEHEWSTVSIEKSFVSTDHTSIGLRSWYADLVIDQFTARNLSTGMLAEDSIVNARIALTNVGSDYGMHLIDTEYRGESLTTIAQEYGVLMEGEVMLHLNTWSAQLHDTPLMMSSGSEAVVRSFSPMNTAPSSSDALGDGVLYYGTSGSPTISTTTSYRLIETAITCIDLQGNPVEADVVVHGFALRSNSNGAVTLPLIGSGSTVDVTLNGTGVRVTLYGGQTGQSVQVPLIPQGDWTIASGQTIVLGPRPDGQDHHVTGDLVIGNNARLTLKSTALVVAPGYSVSLQGTGVLQGEDAEISTSSLQASGQSLLTAFPETSFDVYAEVQWGCSSTRQVSGLTIFGNLTVQPGCEIHLTQGSVQGSVVAQTGALFTSASSLSIQVLDKGIPVEGALITVDGTLAYTNAQGRVDTSSVARTVDDMGETWSGLKSVVLQRDNFVDSVTWDTNRSLEHIFMASTVPSGDLSSWLVLERQWSPYMLDGDMTVLAGSTMTIQDGVSLRITEASVLTVNGILDVGAATLSSTGYGARWGGLAMGTSAQASIEMSGSQLVESSPALTVSGHGEVNGDGVFIARSASDPLIVVSYGSQTSLSLRNSNLQDGGSSCINAYPSSGTISLTNVSFASCNGAAIWAQQIPLEIKGLKLNSGIDQGLELTGVEGRVEDLDATAYLGSGAIVSLNNIRGGFTIDGMMGTVTGTGGIVGQDNTGLTLLNIRLNGAPAIDVDSTSGQLRNIVLEGDGTGVALTSHHGRGSANLEVENLTISGYSVGIAMHLDEGELSAPLLVRSSSISATSAIATELYPLRLESVDVMGSLDISQSDVHAIDVQIEEVNTDAEASFLLFRTIALEARRGGAVVSAQFAITYGNGEQADVVVSGSTVDVELLVRKVIGQVDTEVDGWMIEALVSGSPSATLEINEPLTAASLIIVTIQMNLAPTVTLLEPLAGTRVMEGDSLRALATASDDMDGEEALTLSWKVYDLQGHIVLEGGNEREYYITDLTAGYYIVEVEATDSFGLSTTASTDIEFTQLDTDGDWSSSCSSDSWFDPQTGKSCGPDIYDEDDDNDGFSDAKDAFPLDPCAQLDTDGDTQPDVIDCPEGYTTWLTEDMDDDGNGIPDELEGQQVNDDDLDINALMVVLTLLVVVVCIFFARLRRGGPGDLTSLDQRHL